MLIHDEYIYINDEKSINIKHFVVPSMGIIGIKGKSGCGKSTFLNHINHGVLSRYFLGHVSYMKPRNMFFDFMNMKQNIDFQLSLISRKEDHELLDQLLDDFQLHDLLKKKPKALSTGEMQRFAFILQVLKQSPVILMDEPTASVNDEYVQLMKKYIVDMSKKSLIILTSHHPGMFEICDSIYEIKDNQLICIKEIDDDLSVFKDQKLHFPCLSITTTKFINHLRRNIVFYLAIAIVCSIIGVMHTSKGILLDEQLEYLDNYIQNEMFLVKSEKPYSVDTSENGLKINEDEYQKMTDIPDIKCYPMYDISNLNLYDSEYATLIVSNNQQTIETLDNKKICIVPYFKEEVMNDNIIEGKTKENGIYVSENFRSYLQSQDLMNLKFELDIYIPTHYTTEGIESWMDNEKYVFSSPVFISDVEKVSFEDFDGIISADYSGYSQNQCNIYVPYSYIEKLISKHRSIENKKVDDTIYYPYSFGSVYVEVQDISKIKEIKQELQDISENFHIFDAYHNLEKAVQVYEEFKHTIDIFEYIGIGVTFILAFGFWYMRKKNDCLLKQQFMELRLSSTDFLKYLLCDILLETILTVILTVIMTNLVFVGVQAMGYFYCVYSSYVFLINVISVIILMLFVRLLIEGGMIYDRN